MNGVSEDVSPLNRMEDIPMPRTVAAMLLLVLAACASTPLLPAGSYAADNDSAQTITIHADGRIAFRIRVSAAWRGTYAERPVEGEFPYRTDGTGEIHFTVSSNSVAAMDLAHYVWAWRDGAILRTDPDTGTTLAFFVQQ